jgi:hypothetical protein
MKRPTLLFVIALAVISSPVLPVSMAIAQDDPVSVAAEVSTPSPAAPEAPAAIVETAPAAMPEIVDGGTSPVIPVVPEAEVTMNDVALAIAKSQSDWQSFGWLAGVMGIVYCLILLSKIPIVSNFLTSKGIKKWIRPILAAVFGGLSGAVTAFYAGVGIPQTILAGVIAGLSSSGFHEFVSVVSSSKEREKRS